MYKSMRFHRKLCKIFHERFNVHASDCDVYSIWHFYPHARWKAFKEYLANTVLCQAQWFTIVYWLVLLISTLGTLYSLVEFVSLYCGCRKCVSTWRERKYYVLPYSVLRKCRLVGALVMLNAWLLLCYAVVNVSPSHMTPWITINMFVLSFELLTWIIEVMVGATKLDMHTLLTFLLPLANFLFVRCVRTVFQHAIETNEADGLRLWNRL